MVDVQKELVKIRKSGLYNEERLIQSPQGAIIQSDDASYVNMCSNNYLGLASHPRVVGAAMEGLKKWGFGMASVRFICGTATPHKELEASIAKFLKMEDCILYPSCFDANGGLFETLLGPEDAVISHKLNHASIIDGIRLCKAKRFFFHDPESLETALKSCQDANTRLIATDGVFSMDGTFADLPIICQLAKRYKARVMVDDCHATGFIGPTGRGTPELFGQSVDILTGTLGKALGGASGGYTAASKPIVELLRQRSRPYLFSNTLAPSIVAASLEIFSMLDTLDTLRKKLHENTLYFRRKIDTLGLNTINSSHPIVPILLGDPAEAHKMAQQLAEKNIFAVAFSYPVVPEGKARVRFQISASHEKEDLDQTLSALENSAGIR